VRFGRAGRLSWPLLALVLLLIGLLGAALATKITNADGPSDGGTRLAASAAHYPRADAPGGMITDNGSTAFAADPASTEAKDA
jgi:serine/threonine-protein kinase